MTERQKYLLGCRYAIKQMIEQGNYSVLLDCQSDNPIHVEWKKALEWIAEEYKVEPRKKGYWIGQKRIGFGEWKECKVLVKEDGCVPESCTCSECGEWLVGSDEYDVNGRFCPYCGAEMESVQDGNE